jgi:hypothetical protein
MDSRHRKELTISIHSLVSHTYNYNSIRAYRMRIDEWSLRKYKSREDALEETEDLEPANQSLSGSEMPPPDAKSTKLHNNGKLKFGSNYYISANPMGADEVLALIQEPDAAPYALEILITKWQVGGRYLDALATVLRTNQSSFLITRCAKDGRPLLFKLVEDFVHQSEQIMVGKLLLESLFLGNSAKRLADVAWLTSWDAACQRTDWFGVKEILYDSSTVSIRAGELFLNSARAVLADQLLRRWIQQLRGLKARNSSDLKNPEEVRTCRLDLIYLLEESRDLDMLLQPTIYKYSPEIIENDEYGNWIPYKKNDPRYISLANWCRYKYLQMTSGRRTSDDASEDAKEREWMSASNHTTPQGRSDTVVATHAYGQEPRPSRSNSHELRVVTAQPKTLLCSTSGTLATETLPEEDYGGHPVMKALMTKWKSLKGFKSYVHSILAGDPNGVFIFDPTSSDNENLFDVIDKHVPKDEQLPVTKAVLLACSTINKEDCWRPWTLDWWLSCFHTTSWDDLRSKTETAQLERHLWRPISSAALKLLLDATYSLVGERLLNELKTVMISLRTSPGYSSCGDNSVRYDDLLKQYIAILGTFRERSLNVEPACLAHALNAMG